MLTANKFVVTEQTKLLSAKGVYDIVDGDTRKPLGTAAVRKTGFMKLLLGLVFGKDRMTTTVDVRQKSDDAILFSVRRSGFLFSKVQALDAERQVLGTYKTKKFSLAGGFHIYDKDGKHVTEIRGKMFKAEYKILMPDGKSEMGTVSKKWGGMAKELFTSAKTYAVEIAPRCAEDFTAKMLILGAAIAIDAIFTKKGGKGGGGGKAEGDDGDNDD